MCQRTEAQEMKYKDLLEFCALILATEADESALRDYHVQSDGPISKVWGRVYVAIRDTKDFDYRTYLRNIIDLPEEDEDPTIPPPNKLH
jgi:hypothetical protein